MVNVAKDPKKQKSRKKGKELNRKGEMKEGGDMDAFLEKDGNALPKNASAGVPPVTPVSHEELAIQDKLNNESGSVIVDELDKEEQRKIVEKNEENTKVSNIEQIGEKEFPVVIEVVDVVNKTTVGPALKYEYKEDQWSPLNPEGKKQYDRSFLLQLQQEPMSQMKPEGLPDLEVIRDATSRPKQFDRNTGGGNVGGGLGIMQMKNRGIGSNFGGMNDFTPNFFNQPTSRAPMRGRSSQHGGRKEAPPKKINITLSLNQDIKLHESENAWKPSHKVDEDLTPEQERTEKLNKTVRGILNKLTPQNFTTLIDQVASLDINNEDRLSGVIDLVFEKAIDEPNFSVPYANMCKRLAQLKVPQSANPASDVNFRKLILIRCQREFEKDTNDEVMRGKRLEQIEKAETEETRKELKSELEEEERKSKRRSLGNIRFIGELFKLGMLTPSIMHDCLNKLITAGDEDSLECLCKLLTTIGKDLDTQSNPYKQQPQMQQNQQSKTQQMKISKQQQQQQQRKQQDEQPMNFYFNKMQDVVKARHTSSRVRFMLQDVMDLRKGSWVPRREDNNPKTIDQIHKEVEKEKQAQQQALLQMPMSMPKRMDDRDRGGDRRMGGSGLGGGGGGGGGGRRGNDNDGGWNMVSSNKRTIPPVDPNKTRITQMDYSEFQLGPNKGASWHRGSSGGVKTGTQQEPDRSSTPANRFQPLASDHMQQSESRSSSRQSGLLSSSRDSSKVRGSSDRGGPGSPQFAPPSQRGSSQSSSAGATRFREQEQVVAHIKSGAYLQPASREASITRESDRNISVESSTIVTASDEQNKKKLETLVDEFIQNNDFKEAIESLSELCSQQNLNLSQFVIVAINHSVTRTLAIRQTVGQLFSELVKRDVVTSDHFLVGLEDVLGNGEDTAIDIPKFWEYMAEMLSPMLIEGSLSLKVIMEACDRVPKQLCTKFISHLLKTLVNKMPDKSRVRTLWKDSGLQFSKYLKPDKWNAFFENEKCPELKFLLEDDSHELPSNTRSMIDDDLRKGLDVQLGNLQSTNEVLFDWVTAHVPESQRSESSFIRALVTAVAESAIKSKADNSVDFDEKLFGSRSNLIKRYVDRAADLEMETLYALQVLTHRLQHPPKLLNQIFQQLYDNEVISEEAFLQWKSPKEPHTIEGHAVAVKSVNAFLDYVSNHDQEDEDDEVAAV